MRIAVRHVTAYAYDTPVGYVIQNLRLTPRPHDGQSVRRWHIDVDHDVRLSESEDGFGNIVHTFSINAPIDHLTVAVEGHVNTVDTDGVIRGTRERFPPSLFLRQTALTEPDADIIGYAQAAMDGETQLDRLHALMVSIAKDIEFDTDHTHVATNAREAFNHRKGVCQDHSHIMLSAARAAGIPARYISGYFMRADDVVDQEAGHAWIEAYTGPELGWVGFDPANGICVTDQHIRVAVGLDYQDAAPTRGTRHGGDEESLTVSLRVTQGKLAQAQ